METNFGEPEDTRSQLTPFSLFLIGLISTMPEYANEHPDYVMDSLIEEFEVKQKAESGVGNTTNKQSDNTNTQDIPGLSNKELQWLEDRGYDVGEYTDSMFESDAKAHRGRYQIVNRGGDTVVEVATVEQIAEFISRDGRNTVEERAIMALRTAFAAVKTLQMIDQDNQSWESIPGRGRVWRKKHHE